ncbi:potassium-transporting ATPase subunit KdpC [Ralstonia pseudosolanacearum]|uniref:Potassium-transporting ATPase KdpC subunit n=1 Tax=Ralstonia nicotianae (strain ATCC BAA-1114 / GMI1000) TaxID=267608 RepID=KDPC_RALN1|nr:potassium-transporting ATPase subunit KdpC [Ralstonia pseudosolanacearum]Q8XU10.1 RecName: Full=Potassium-transporting ATPase KdpC subunit; AltName: Full=ATP phosphohydrolase [potassium-transporting] C chain; AltName: Full=Potassium-binding and translocating subunit C; AltName: Full=Potassium-translocating ATPase C chain [Ralstonia pseudosolanacearum GMI1000]AST28852.1 potassium-transporting ATPase subunit C [Ralstonia pseudosolanacearum]MDC6283534.1 potassium-transporting ATPase subunit KdpC
MATTTQPAHAEAPQQGGLLRAALVIFVGLSLVTGVLYPVVVTGIGKAAFPAQAGGSIIERGGKPVGSALIGQNFSEPQYFWGRLSATSPNPYNGAASSGSNLGPSNPALTDAAKARIAALKEADPANTAPIPVDLVTASASGLDPHISPAAAAYQVERVARARHLPVERVKTLVAEHTTAPILGVFGEPVVNVLELNLGLGDLK